MNDADPARPRDPLPRCPACGAAVRCGAHRGEASCWCLARPPIAPDPALPADACLCPACLDARIGAGERG